MFAMRIQLICKIRVPFAEKGQQNSGQETLLSKYKFCFVSFWGQESLMI